MFRTKVHLVNETWISLCSIQATLLSGAYKMREIGEHFGVHYVTVSRTVKEYEKEMENAR